MPKPGSMPILTRRRNLGCEWDDSTLHHWTAGGGYARPSVELCCDHCPGAEGLDVSLLSTDVYDTTDYIKVE